MKRATGTLNALRMDCGYAEELPGVIVQFLAESATGKRSKTIPLFLAPDLAEKCAHLLLEQVQAARRLHAEHPRRSN